jgi:protein-S-isoprenylcysteine O-methyltransferase Ste14
MARRLRGGPDARPQFRTPLPYRLVRHPMMTAFIVAFLAVPTMTAGHLLFAGLSCGYIVIAVRLEERDLATELPEYPAYAAVTPRFVPRLRRTGTRRG